MPGLVVITVPPASTQLTALATAKAEIGVTTTVDDAYIGKLIDRASAAIASFIGSALGTQSLSETFRFGWSPGIGPASATVAPYGTPLNTQYKPLVMALPNITAIATIVENGTTLTAGTDFEYDGPAGLIYRLRNSVRSWWNLPTVVVTYTAGWVLPNDGGTQTMPCDIEDCCLALVKSAYFSRARDPNIAMDMLDGDRTQFWDRSLSAMVIDSAMQDTLVSYNNRPF